LYTAFSDNIGQDNVTTQLLPFLGAGGVGT